MADFAELTRRGFIGAMLAAAVAPAIVRASSLMPIYVPAPDWRDMVRTTIAYDIRVDAFMVRFDMGTADRRFHVDMRAPYAREKLAQGFSEREFTAPAERVLLNYAKHHGIRPRQLVKLPLLQAPNTVQQHYGLRLNAHG